MSVVLLSMQDQKALDFVEHILICVQKMNEGLTCLVRVSKDICLVFG